MIFRSYVLYIGTLLRLHSSVKNLGNNREVCLCFALIAIYYDVSNPRSLPLMWMIHLRQDTLGMKRTESFWDGMRVVLIKIN